MENGVVVVAVDTSKEVTDHALEWAAKNVIGPSDSLVLLAVLPSQKNPPDTDSKHRLLKMWGLLRNKKSTSSDMMCLIDGPERDMVRKVNVVCELTMQQLFLSHNLKKVHGEVHVLANAHLSSIASMAAELRADWVVLDRHFKKEADCCVKQLICNIVVMDNATPRILRSVNPRMRKKPETHVKHSDPSVADMLGLVLVPSLSSMETGSTTTRSSLRLESPDYKCSSPSTTNAKHINLNSQHFHSKQKNYIPLKSKPQSPERGLNFPINQQPGKRRSYSGPLKTRSEMKGNNLEVHDALPAPARRSVDSPHLLRPRTPKSNMPNVISPMKDSPASLKQRTSSIRRAMDLSIRHPPTPPPLCSICKHKAPHFGKAPKRLRYEEIKNATGGFAVENFLAEGGFGLVYKGVLSDGQVIAVKQFKLPNAQGALEFCAEVEVLSCAQHKNLVMLVGYCIEVEWLLVYEFVCNGSLDKHLYEKDTGEVMAWHRRIKVARGAARGLRYLHEDCRAGCIVHRDFRPSNILLTHDFEPMVGDFGLARWQADGQSAEESRVVGAFGYLAPEYIQSGLVTEKADVYAYGVVLLELISGYKATEFSKNKGKQFVSEWGLPLLHGGVVEELMDPRLANEYVYKQVKSMIRAAELCLLPDPEQRPRMSQVLKILDGEMPSDMVDGYRRQFLTYTNENMDRNTRSFLSKTMRPKNQSPVPMRERTKKSEEIKGNWSFRPDGYQDKTDGCYTSDQPGNLVSEEYQVYLKGSLIKFIENMNMN